MNNQNKPTQVFSVSKLISLTPHEQDVIITALNYIEASADLRYKESARIMLEQKMVERMFWAPKGE